MTNLEKIKEIFLSGKKINKNSHLWNDVYKVLPKDLSYQQYKYHIINGIYNIPKCKYTGDNCYFLNYNGSYAPTNKYYYLNYIVLDTKVKVEWLKYEYLFDIGISEEFVRKNDYKIKRIRTFLSTNKVYNKSELINYLLNDNFTTEKAHELYKSVKIDDPELLKSFINEFHEIKTIKNHELEYWVKRGHNIKSAKNKIDYFFQKGTKSIKQKRKNPTYDEWFKLTRKNGGSHSHIQNKKNKILGSKIENEILYSLSEKGYTINKRFFSPCNNVELSQLYNKRNFIHDALINDKYIFEYNGGYWHKDYLTFNRFTKEEYLFEIKKAYNCLNEVNRKNNLNYIVVWENDFNSVSDIVSYIEYVISLDEENEFYSSREIDHEYYINYYNYRDKFEKEKKKFKKIVKETASTSHCESLKVGAIAVKNGRIIATGINGTVSGLMNCDDYFRNLYDSEKIQIPYEDWKKTDQWKKLHTEWSNKREIHAEMSLICEVARTGGTNLQGCDIYVTHEPCVQCSKNLSTLNIKNIFYINKYDKSDPISKQIINNSGIMISQI
ncbi:MAG: deaminase [bacterium]